MNRHAFIIIIGMLATFWFLSFSGCGPKHPGTAAVSGRVTFQGKPVTDGRIMFQPERGRPAVGAIGADGSYRLTTFAAGDGALPGHHRVTIEATRVTGGSLPKSMQDELRGTSGTGAPTIEWLVPEHHSRPETSPLTAEVEPGPNSIDFNL